MTSFQNPRASKSTLLSGWRNLLDFRRNPLGFLMRIFQESGDLGFFKIGPRDCFMLSHPDYIRDVLVTHHQKFAKGHQTIEQLLGNGLLTSEGEFHRRQRRLMQPGFHKERIAQHGSVITKYGVKFREKWEDGATIDIAKEMTRLTLGIVGSSLFSADLESEAPEIVEALDIAFALFKPIRLPLADLIAKLLPLPSVRKFGHARDRLNATVYRMIREHREQAGTHKDLLSMLLTAQDAEGGGEGMSDAQIRDEAITILVAGHETMANALAWTWYLLSKEPAVQERVHQEIDRILAGRLPTFEDIPQLQYTNMVFTEAMRLYPPVWMLGRRVVQEHKFGDVRLPPGSTVLMSQYIMHHHPHYFPEPLVFKPERWTPEAQSARPKFVYFPFGGGAHLCIGEPFAWLEGVLLLATIAEKWSMQPIPSHPIELQLSASLRPKYGIKLRLVKRTSYSTWEAADREVAGI